MADVQPQHTPPRTPPATAAPPPQVTMGLLNYVTAHSMDEDYAHVAQLKASRGDETRNQPRRGGVVVLALFGALIATAGIQTARSAGVDASSHDNLVRQVADSREVLDDMRRTLASLEAQTLVAQRDNRLAANERDAEQAVVDRRGLQMGSVPVSGPGVRMVVDDAPNASEDAQFVLDKDLRNIVNGLWAAGAEAVSINGRRITTRSAIRFAGNYITVNYDDVVPPYTVLAIGDPDVLSARFVESTTGTYWLNARNTFGLRFEMNVDESLSIPAVKPDLLAVRTAEPKAEDLEGAE